jgi:hypothetical protein
MMPEIVLTVIRFEGFMRAEGPPEFIIECGAALFAGDNHDTRPPSLRTDFSAFSLSFLSINSMRAANCFRNSINSSRDFDLSISAKAARPVIFLLSTRRFLLRDRDAEERAYLARTFRLDGLQVHRAQNPFHRENVAPEISERFRL